MKHVPPKPALLAALLVAIVSTAVSCSGGGGGSNVAGIGGTGMVAVGQVTGFGSVFVNGEKYSLRSDSRLLVNGQDAGEAELRTGMVVAIRGSRDSAGDLTLDELTYEAEIRGPITGLTPGTDGQITTLDIMGRTVTVDAVGTVFDDGYGFALMKSNDLVEVSGFVAADASLHATRIEKKGVFSPSDTVVVKDALAKDALATIGGNNEFTLQGGIRVRFDTASTIMNGLGSCDPDTGCVLKITGSYNAAEGLIEADRIEGANALPDASDEAQIEGLITDFAGTGSFKVNSVAVDAANAGREPASLTLSNGLAVEVEGRLSGGTLIADRIKAREAGIEIQAYVADTLTGNTVRLQITPDASLTVRIEDSQTRMADETGAVANTPASPMRFDDLSLGNYLEIKAVRDNNGKLVATTLVRTSGDNEIVLQGPLDSEPTLTGQRLMVSILGITFASDGDTEFDQDDGRDNDQDVSDAAAFQALLRQGTIVKVSDEITSGTTGDGTAEEMEVETGN